MRLDPEPIAVVVLLLWAAAACGQQSTRAAPGAPAVIPSRPKSITTRPSPGGGTSVRTATRPATQNVRYTAPGPQFRGAGAVVAAAGAASMGRVVSGGKEVSEASVAGSRFVGGAPGLNAPQALTANAVVGQPGLQRGLPIGFGPLPRQNIFTRSVNPISGPGGAHAILTAAGFGPALRR